MFDMNELLARLQNGEDAQVIANQFADTLNQAIQEKTKADEQAKQKADKIAAAQYVVDVTLAFIREFYPELDGEETLTGAELCDIMDELAPELQKLVDLVSLFETKPKAKITTKVISKDPIADFLKVNGLLN